MYRQHESRAEGIRDVGAGSLNPLLLKWGSLLLLCIGLAYLVYGTYSIFTRAGDYGMRWVEEHYVFQGKNPLDVLATAKAFEAGVPPPDTGRDGTIDPKLGAPNAGYPPWAYVTGAILTWPSSFVVARALYGCINLILVAGLILWAYRFGKSEDKNFGLFFAASLLAVNSICTTFIVGQYGVLVLAALVAAYIFNEKDQWIASGLCLAIAMTKVTLAGPFVLPFLFKGRWRVLFVAGSYLLLASLWIWHVVKTNPLEMLGQMTKSSDDFQKLGYSLNNLLEIFGLGIEPATKLAAIISVILASVLLYAWRSESMLTCYAIAALAARAWCYHALYDNIILAFVLLDLALLAWKTQSRLAFWSYLLFGLTLWLPGHFVKIPGWFEIQWLVWVGAFIVLLFLTKKRGLATN